MALRGWMLAAVGAMALGGAAWAQEGSDWIAFTGSDDTDVYGMKAEAGPDGFPRVWVRHELHKADTLGGKPYLSAVSLEEIDCRRNMRRTEEASFYAGHDLTGGRVSSYQRDGDDSWDPVAAGSVAEDAVKLACGAGSAPAAPPAAPSAAPAAQPLAAIVRMGEGDGVRRYVYVGHADQSGAAVFLDEDSLVRRGGGVAGVAVAVFDKPGPRLGHPGVAFLASITETDCAGRSRLGDVGVFDGAFHRLSVDGGVEDWERVDAESINGGVVEAMCRPEKVEAGRRLRARPSELHDIVPGAVERLAGRTK